MTQEQIIEGLLAWTREHLPELQGGYDFAPAMKLAALPDVVVELSDVGLSLGSDDFPLLDIQQRLVVTYRCLLSFMVDNSDPETAASDLRRFADTLLDQVLSDGTLGGRVPFVSPFVSFDYSAPFVEYDDGTRGREMTMNLTIGGVVEDNQ